MNKTDKFVGLGIGIFGAILFYIFNLNNIGSSIDEYFLLMGVIYIMVVGFGISVLDFKPSEKGGKK